MATVNVDASNVHATPPLDVIVVVVIPDVVVVVIPPEFSTQFGN